MKKTKSLCVTETCVATLFLLLLNTIAETRVRMGNTKLNIHAPKFVRDQMGGM